MAASITVVLLLAGFWYFNPQNEIITYQTDFGETRDITLPDGSLVTLNAHSILQFNAEDFKKSTRDVWMQGEAFFEIKKFKTPDGKATKFFVHTDDLDIEVLGTQFNVNTRRTSTKVVLSEGKVRLNMTHSLDVAPVTMAPGEMVTFTLAQNAISKENVNVDVHTAWKQQVVIFKDTSLQEIIELLEDTYGLQIQLKNKDAVNRRYNGAFEDPKPDKILLFVTQAFGLEMERYNDLIILK
jgi:ferric-dicitrate binding protein FerR (iron transport regulator)